MGTPSGVFAYFAYGSNMAVARLRTRCPSARLHAVGLIRAHALRWHKQGMDGSGKCDAFFTGHPSDRVWGAVYWIPAAERSALRRAEHFGVGYREKEVDVQLRAEGGKTGSIRAMTYAALLVDPDLRPQPWYRQLVIEGARDLALPVEYRRAIASVSTTETGGEPQR